MDSSKNGRFTISFKKLIKQAFKLKQYLVGNFNLTSNKHCRYDFLWDN